MLVDGHWLYLYGGLLEAAVRETTLDDAWRLDLRTRSRWQCLLSAREHAWVGDEDEVDGDDEDGDGSDDDDGDDETSEGSEGGSDGGSDGESGSESDGGSTAAAGGSGSGTAAASAARSHGRSGRVNKEEERIRQLRDSLGLHDAETTPAPGEKLSQFFLRTGDAWVRRYIGLSLLAEGERIAGRALRRKAFELARARYDELWPMLSELYELEEVQRTQEAARSARSAAVKRGGGKAAGGAGKKGGKGR